MQALSGPPTVVGSCPCLVSSRIPYRARRDIVLEKGPIGALYFFGGFTPLQNALAGSCCPGCSYYLDTIELDGHHVGPLAASHSFRPWLIMALTAVHIPIYV